MAGFETDITTEEANFKKDVTTEVAKAESWLKVHERIVITFLVLASLVFLGNKFLTNRANVDNLKAQQTQAQLVDQQNTNKQLAAQVQQTASQYQNLIASLSQQNAKLVASISSRNASLAAQQTTDKTLPPNELAIRWADLGGFDPQDLNVQSAGILANDTAVVATVQQLEQVPVLTQNVKDANIEENNTKTELSSANTLIGQQKEDISGLNIQITDDQTACKAEVTAVKAAARKGKVKSFLYGFGIGFVAGAISHF